MIHLAGLSPACKKLSKSLQFADLKQDAMIGWITRFSSCLPLLLRSLCALIALHLNLQRAAGTDSESFSKLADTTKMAEREREQRRKPSTTRSATGDRKKKTVSEKATTKKKTFGQRKKSNQESMKG